MQRLERLINLVAALLAAERPLTRTEIEARVPGYPPDRESARRAFERDKDALRSMGIPISVERVDPSGRDVQEGYRIHREQYELPDPGLDADELAALHLAVSAVHLEGMEATAAIWKLGGAREQPEREAVEVALAGSEHLPVLFAAIGDSRPVRFRYRDAVRTVDPWRLTFRSGRWYLVGRDHDRDEERQFRLDRMDGAEPAGAAGSFDRPPPASGPPPRPWQMGTEEPVLARVLVDADQAAWAARHAGPEHVVERRSDGSIVLELAVTNRAAFRTFVLGFLEHAEVLDPPALRDELVDWLQALT